MKKYNRKIVHKVIKHYPNMDTGKLAEKLHVSKSTIYRIAGMHNVKKSPEMISQNRKQTNKNLIICGISTRYKKSHVPANKGKKMPLEQKKKLQHTFFKSGHRPHNLKPDYHERISKEGYIEIKIPGRGYMPKHRYIWQQKFGPIPHDKILTFVDGNKKNIDISNLTLLSKSENMLRNNIKRLPKELISVIKLNSKLKQKIHEKQN